MLRGLVFGLIWGVIVSGFGLALVSLLAGPPDQISQAPQSQDVDVPAGSEFKRNRPDARPAIPGSEETEGGAATPEVTEAEPENAPLADTASAAVPQSSSDAPDVPSAPETGSDGLTFTLGDGDVAAGGTESSPRIASPASSGETMPEKPDELIVLGEPEGTAPNDEPSQPASEEAAPLSPAVQLPKANDVATQGRTTTAASDQMAPADDAIADDNMPAPDTQSAEVAEPESDAAQSPEVDATQGESESDIIVAVRRLPTIGATETPAEDDAPSAEASDEGGDEARPTLGALARNARPFVPEGDKPLMSIVLIDVGAEGLGREELTTFSFPVTIAVDPTQPGFRQSSQAYKAAGNEVLILAPPVESGTTPADMANQVDRLLKRIPEGIALLDAEEGGFQSNRRLLDEVVSALLTSGHGLLTYDRGLNTAQQVAEQEGLPAATIFRTLDADGESVETIKRYLERAAFRAGQEGHVVMIGHTYPDTVKALFSWVQDTRSDSVTIAPLSAVLRQ